MTKPYSLADALEDITRVSNMLYGRKLFGQHEDHQNTYLENHEALPPPREGEPSSVAPDPWLPQPHSEVQGNDALDKAGPVNSPAAGPANVIIFPGGKR